jgi:hypothetical protein
MYLNNHTMSLCRSSKRSYLTFLFCIAAQRQSFLSVLAQQNATFLTPVMDFSESHRQSVCDRQAQLDNGTLELRNALEGLAIRPVLFYGNLTDFILPSARIPEENPGIIVEVLDELARRAQFTWRNSFGAANADSDNATIDEMFVWSVRTYDLSAVLWTQSVRRMNYGASFPEGFYDASIIMVGEKQSASSKLNVWSFLEPFTAGMTTSLKVNDG